MFGYLKNHLDKYEIPAMNFRFRKKVLPPAVENAYRCDICPDSYNSEDEVIVHRRVAHKHEMLAIEEDLNSCKICALGFKSREELYKHTKILHLLSSEDATQIEHEIFVCAHCDAIFFNKPLLIFHIKFEHTGPTNKSGRGKRYTCPLCGLRRKTQSLWVHFNNHDLKSLSCCPICFNKSTDSDDLVNEHCKSHQKHFVCSSCDYVSTKQSQHTTHCARHNKEDILVKPKKTNGFSCFISHNMSKNVKVQRLGCLNGVMLPLGMSVCIVCKYITTSYNDMERHVLLDHGTFVKKKHAYKCTECDEEFFNAVLLKQHRFKGCQLTYIEIREDEESQEGVEVLNILETITDDTTTILADSINSRELVSSVPYLIDDI